MFLYNGNLNCFVTIIVWSGMRVSNFFYFWVNYSFKDNCI